MDRGYNKCVFIGYLTEDPQETRSFHNNAIAHITLEVQKTHRTINGREHENIAHIPVTGYTRIAEIMLHSGFRKGDRLMVEGEYRTQQAYTIEGFTYTQTDIVAHHVVDVTARDARCDDTQPTMQGGAVEALMARERERHGSDGPVMQAARTDVRQERRQVVVKAGDRPPRRDNPEAPASQRAILTLKDRFNGGCKDFKDRLKLARKHRQLSQGDLADLAGVDQATISNLERGKHLGSSHTIRIATALGISPRWLSDNQGEMIE